MGHRSQSLLHKSHDDSSVFHQNMFQCKHILVFHLVSFLLYHTCLCQCIFLFDSPLDSIQTSQYIPISHGIHPIVSILQLQPRLQHLQLPQLLLHLLLYPHPEFLDKAHNPLGSLGNFRQYHTNHHHNKVP